MILHAAAHLTCMGTRGRLVLTPAVNVTEGGVVTSGGGCGDPTCLHGGAHPLEKGGGVEAVLAICSALLLLST
jgi:hypothetical protein